MDSAKEREQPLESHLNFSYQENPFKGLSQEQRDEIARQMCNDSKVEFEKTFLNLVEKLLPSVNPVHLLSHFAFYDQIFLPTMRMRGVKKADDDPTIPLEQAHLELLQALLLRIDPDKFPESSPPNYPQIIQTIRDETRSLYTTWSLSRIIDMMEDPKKGMASEFFRMRTALVRNWGHTRQVFDWLTKMFSLHDQGLMRDRGISFTEIIASVRTLLNLVQSRINALKLEFQPIAIAKTEDRILRAGKKQGVFTAKEIEEIRALEWNLNEIRAFTISRMDVRLHAIFVFSEEDIAAALPGRGERLWEILLQWVTPQGALESMPRDHLMMSNPISTSPIMALADKTLFWPLIFIFQSFGLEMLMPLLSKKAQDRFVKRTKPRFCEDKVNQVLREAFPGAAIFANSRYVEDGKEFENDCFLVFDAFCLVVEVKSGRMRPSAHRGSLQSLKEGLKEIVIEGCEQALRGLKALRAQVEFRDVNDNAIPVDLNNIVEWIPIVVTFEHLGEFSLEKSEAVELGLLPADVKECLCVNIADLESLMAILPSSVQRLHYLSRRLSIENNFNFRGDEMDLLVFYLKTGFAIGQAEYDQEETLVLTGLSAEIDPYLLKISNDVPRPTRYLSPKWKVLLREIEKRCHKNWTLACCRLLDQDREGMDMVAQKLPEIYKDIFSKNPPTDRRDILVLMAGPEQRKRAVIFIAGYGLPTEERRSRAMDACQQVSESEGDGAFLVFYMDLADPLLPYHSLYFFNVNGGEESA